MNGHTSPTRRSAGRFLIGPLAALCLAVPFLAGTGNASEEKGQSARVAKKMEKARAKAHQAEEEREALRHFQEDVADYAQLHGRQLAKLGKESVATQQALAHSIASKRHKAGPGDIFRPEVQPHFRRLIAEQLEGPDARDARQSLVEGNPGDEEGSVPVVVGVNVEYPVGSARSTVPPSVLLTLPPLPEALHYRFVGRDLLLVDSVAQLIVDFMPAAAPEVARK